MGEAADDAIDQMLRYEYLYDENGDEDFGEACWFGEAWSSPAYSRQPRFLTRNQLTAIRIKTGGATRAAHEVAGVLRHLLALPR